MTRLLFRCLLPVLLISILFASGAANADTFTPFTVEGNAKKFRLDEKTDEILLADCRVTYMNIDAEDVLTIPAEYQTVESVQKLFDLIIDSEMLAQLTVDQKHELNMQWSSWDGGEIHSVQIGFESLEIVDTSKGTRNLLDGQGLGTISLTNCCNAPSEYPEDSMVQLSLFLVTNKGKTPASCFVLSEELFALVGDMTGR